ncbi:hypothetical protein NARC_30179 [Candidatus Nitrosocosmicus arcticus]|uniref:Uncharacterized protein n=1 Tax=Candidatus Nitrosocosmicus arcticus TaxID=2035267 RepID=A0A557SXX9_9ARCH|nr:hypothetical protein NARC_30179 [Candidatus Nitrosocosmicus arcticus]
MCETRFTKNFTRVEPVKHHGLFITFIASRHQNAKYSILTNKLKVLKSNNTHLVSITGKFNYLELLIWK